MSKREMTAREMGRKGGKARAAKLTAEELTAIGKLGASRRWAGHTKKSQRKPDHLDIVPSAKYNE